MSKKKESSVSEFFYPELRAKYLDMATNLSFVVAIAICCGLAMAEVKKCYEVLNIIIFVMLRFIALYYYR